MMAIDRIELTAKSKSLRILNICGVICLAAWVVMVLLADTFKSDFVRTLTIVVMFWSLLGKLWSQDAGIFIEWRASEIEYKTHKGSGVVDISMIKQIEIGLDEIKLYLENEEIQVINIERFEDYNTRLKIKDHFSQLQKELQTTPIEQLMRKTHFKILGFFILAITTLHATAVPPICSNKLFQTSQQSALQMLRSFYESYIRQVSGDLNENASNSILRKYFTKELFNAIPKLQSKSDSDIFLNAQDSDLSILTSLLILPDKKNKNNYIVSYIYDNAKMEIHLSTVKTKDGYKISSIKF